MQGFDLISALVKETVVGWVHRYRVGTVTFIGWLVSLVILAMVGKIIMRLFKRKKRG